MIANGKFNRLTVWQNREVTDVHINEIINNPKRVNPRGPLIKIAKGLGIYVGN